MRILIVDDYQDHVDTLASLYQLYLPGCTVLGLSDVDQVVEKALDFNPDLIVYDGLMQGMKAWEFAAAYLQHDVIQRPYMVVITGFGSTLQRRLCEEHGFDEYITKPMDLTPVLSWAHKAQKRAEVKKP